MVRAFFRIFYEQCKELIKHPLFAFCMVLLPVFVVFFFTDVMKEGLPTSMPIGVVDLDNTATSRKLIRNLDAYQLSRVTAHYPSVALARKDMQRCNIYGFIYMPKGLENEMIGQRQPTISYYYNAAFIMPGSLVYKEMRAISTLGSAAMGSAKLQAMGLTQRQIKAVLQPIVIDNHAIDNPWLSYNFYLSAVLIPTCLMIFVFLITAFSLGSELKYDNAKNWMKMAGDNVVVAVTGKILPQTIVYTLVMWGWQYWLFIHLGFPHNCSFLFIMFTGLLLVLAGQGFAIFIFGIMPSLRMSMSICALWSVLSFSVAGFTFPVGAMDPEIQAMAWLFPMRSYFMIYQMNVFHGFPIGCAWTYYVVLLVFILLPLLVLPRIKKIYNTFVYIP